MTRASSFMTAAHNTQTTWHPWLRPVARILMGAHLALALPAYS